MNQFRIGGVYRNGWGFAARVASHIEEGLAQCEEWNGFRWIPYTKYHRLSDGRSAWHGYDGGNLDLIPGELHQVNGEWLPIDTNPAWTQAVEGAAQKYMGNHSPMMGEGSEEKLASVKVCEDDIWSDEFISSVIASNPRPFRFNSNPFKFRSGLSYLSGTVAANPADELSFDDLMADLLAKPVKREPLTVDIARYAIAHGGLSGKRADKPAEPQRPRLTWADTKPVDRFPGFSVTSSTTNDPIHLHPLQKMAEGKEGFGSAALLKVR